MATRQRYNEEYEYWEHIQYDKRRARKLQAPPGVHVPNKAEAKLLRRLKAETGMTEEQIRQHKKYRKMLSDAQVAGAKRLDYGERLDKVRKRLMKRATGWPGSPGYGLAKEHPIVQAEYKRLVEAYRRRRGPLSV